MEEILGLRGLDLSAYMKEVTSIPGITGVIYPELTLIHVLIPSLILLLNSIAAALYPAWLAARLDPIRAIRHV